MKSIEAQLTGGHPNSLGNTIEVVDRILAKPELFDELFHCYFSTDAVVRLRVSNAMKRIAKANLNLLLPYLDQFLEDISKIDQASTQWTLAQLFLVLENHMTETQKVKATGIMQHNLANHDDWIVLNQTMDTLGRWAKNDQQLGKWLQPHLERLASDSRKSVAKKAGKLLDLM
ncbi:hypothetical protein [uncultured Croceitalea sp.]|uniref:hypothetical protein n=1 Tax=uncultured Croceitalea sp. TaxID=1798908 RepID=UPI003305B9E1